MVANVVGQHILLKLRMRGSVHSLLHILTESTHQHQMNISEVESELTMGMFTKESKPAVVFPEKSLCTRRI